MSAQVWSQVTRQQNGSNWQTRLQQSKSWHPLAGWRTFRDTPGVKQLSLRLMFPQYAVALAHVSVAARAHAVSHELKQQVGSAWQTSAQQAGSEQPTPA